MKYSIITPVHLWNAERVERFLRTIASVKAISYQDFEWIVIDDGSTVEFLWDQLMDGFDLNLIHKEHQERVLAYNEAFKVARGDWWIFLDSDDELNPEIFNELDQVIKDNPKYKMFNFGVTYQHKDGTTRQRGPFEPKALKVGHEVFGGGNIVNGSFIFHRSVWEKLGGYGEKDLDEKGYVRGIDCTSINYPAYPDQEPPLIRDLFLGTPYDFSAYYQLKFPELQQFYMVKHPNHPKNVVKELGNPWGQDMALWFQYTRMYHSLPVNKYLYKVNPR